MEEEKCGKRKGIGGRLDEASNEENNPYMKGGNVG